MGVGGAWAALVVAAGLSSAAIAAEPRAAELPPETPKVLTLGPSNGRRLYVQAFGIAHAPDSKILVFDGDTFRFLGEVSNGFFGLYALSGDGTTLYSATTFFARDDHGPRTDVVELYDTDTLNLRGEIPLSPHRAQSTAYAPYLTESAGGTYLFVQDATPASSVQVVDVGRRKVLAEIPTEGCFGIYPSPVVAGRFSSLCGDGAAVTVTFDADGHEVSRQRSAIFFDPDKDPLFIAGVPGWDKTIFVSFLGNIHVLDFSGAVAAQQSTWPLVTGADLAAGWRPGGYQLMAYSRDAGQLFIGMHPHGYDGSHKNAALSIWRVDLASHAIRARGPGLGATLLAVTAGSAPKLFALDLDHAVVTRLNGDTLAAEGHSPDNGLIEGGGLMVVK
jgi:methylamine dehydrogenase heavy chain